MAAPDGIARVGASDIRAYNGRDRASTKGARPTTRVDRKPLVRQRTTSRVKSTTKEPRAQGRAIELGMPRPYAADEVADQVDQDRDRRSALTGCSRRCRSFPIREQSTRRCDLCDRTPRTRSGTASRSGELQIRRRRSTHRSSKADCENRRFERLGSLPLAASRRRHRRLSGCRRTAERRRRRSPTEFGGAARRVVASAGGSVPAAVLQSSDRIPDRVRDLENTSGWRARASR
jgi:hypothetical protein